MNVTVRKAYYIKHNKIPVKSTNFVKIVRITKTFKYNLQ